MFLLNIRCAIGPHHTTLTLWSILPNKFNQLNSCLSFSLFLFLLTSFPKIRSDFFFLSKTIYLYFFLSFFFNEMVLSQKSRFLICF